MNTPHIPKYEPGTTVTVGSHSVHILKYLTSGGYAQIYSAQIMPADQFLGTNMAVLKRVIVPDKSHLNILRAEVDAMKRLKHHKYIVSYIDSHAAKSQYMDGTYEVFLIMEYCSRGGLIDFMNTRLQNRLTETEILTIQLHISQGVAAMHTLQPPLIHRDIKIENVLISNDHKYKLCDFGSVSGYIRPPKTPEELAYVRHDIMMSTTAQYRAPEMLDLTKGFSVNDKSDIWALGVFLYKLCYYTTPFEQTGEAGILNGGVEFPPYPHYSDAVKQLIMSMLAKNPLHRPNIFQIIQTVSKLLNVNCPIPNIHVPTDISIAVSNNNTGNMSINGYYKPMNQNSGISTPHSAGKMLAGFQNDMPKPSTKLGKQELFSRSKTVPNDIGGLNERSDISAFLLRKKAELEATPNPLESSKYIDDDSSSTTSEDSFDDHASFISKTQSAHSVSTVDRFNAYLKANDSISEEDSDESFMPGASHLNRFRSDTQETSNKRQTKDEILLKRRSLPFTNNESRRNQSTDSELDTLSKAEKKEQLRQRMMSALNASEDVIKKTKSRDGSVSNDNNYLLKSKLHGRRDNEQRFSSVVVNPLDNSNNLPTKKTPPVKPPKPDHLKPKVPPKPAFLKT